MERTPEQIKRIHVALEQAGNISGAASLLNVSAESLKKVIRDHPELRSYLPGTTAPTEQEVIGRKPLALVSVAESDIVKAVKDADEQVRSGFEAIGVSGDALKEAMAFRDFGRMHFNDMRHYIGGGMAKLFADLMVEVKEVRNEIADVHDIEREKLLREDRSRLVKHCIDVYDRVREASVSAAVIEAKKQEAKEKKKTGKAGFAPLAMEVKGDVHVHEAGKVPGPSA
jgi:hypothetical protein